MSTDQPAIKVRNLGKRYRLGGPVERHSMLRDTIVSTFRSPLQWLAPEPTPEFWALKNVSFDIEPGEVVGIIGKNGAGKSTLLKILSRITTPSEGCVELNGRVGSLLEVGTGFHSELSGRDNIFLSGTILGMKKREIEEKFDAIIKFSEIEPFLDTPVKRYSSGMYVRLAFAVAAHLEPEILLVDEVLAVGDAAFQKKCLGKMGSVAKEGRTVLFVSHNMSAIRQLCPTCLYIHEGHLEKKDLTEKVINYYLESQTPTKPTGIIRIDPAKDFQLTGIKIIDETGKENIQCNCDIPILMELSFKVKKTIPGLYGYLEIRKNDGTVVLVSDSFDSEPNSLDGLIPGIHSFLFKIPERTLGPGNYEIYLNFTSSFNIQSFNVDSPGIVYSFMVFDENSMRGNNRGGFFSTKIKWIRKE